MLMERYHRIDVADHKNLAAGAQRHNYSKFVRPSPSNGTSQYYSPLGVYSRPSQFTAVSGADRSVNAALAMKLMYN